MRIYWGPNDTIIDMKNLFDYTRLLYSLILVEVCGQYPLNNDLAKYLILPVDPGLPIYNEEKWLLMN